MLKDLYSVYYQWISQGFNQKLWFQTVSYTLSNKNQNLSLMDSCAIPAIPTFVKPGAEVNRLKYCSVFKKIISDGSEMDHNPPRLTISTSFSVLSFFPALKNALSVGFHMKPLLCAYCGSFSAHIPLCTGDHLFPCQINSNYRLCCLLRQISVSCSRLACFQQLWFFSNFDCKQCSWMLGRSFEEPCRF